MIHHPRLPTQLFFRGSWREAGSCRGSLKQPSPEPGDYEAARHLSPSESVPWSFYRPPPRAAGVGASPALRSQLRLPECSTCSKRWRGRTSATAGPGAAPPAATAASIAATSAPAAAKAANRAQEAREERLAGGARLRARIW